ncbi:Na(+)/H(+) antiporter NhaA [Enterovibrio norvegicus FF-33]|uniref:Na+/H+ antiporter NhaA n=1 Tax=Enterovibrio norvegicus TaxID=188144 RepID=UPI00031D9BC1|nr:Na+/H+ antiporter NhaA [Enterovibrio norvegicus]OEE68387.1 Na(+)/H(+) antiporter NhaA [Enterovibrio norvegicus FF-33]
MGKKISDFFQLDTAPGIILIASAFLALIIANSALAPYYLALLDTPIHFKVGSLDIEKNLLLWINDGLMAIFFLLIGLEVKRELIQGALRTRSRAMFPLIAAVGGMVFPVLIFVLFNANDPQALGGWAIPAATDIAFTLGVLALFGKRVPVSLKVFLLALAVIDDLGAVIIIALFFSSDLSLLALSIAVLASATLFYMNAKGVARLTGYLLVGAILWVAVLKSGVHATVAGVILGFAVPLKIKHHRIRSPLRYLEHGIHPWSSFVILPLFAFANSGVPMENFNMGMISDPLPLGIILGLLLGKPVGISITCYASIKLGIASLPKGVQFAHIMASSILCGIGFTMSIFITTLAFPGVDNHALVDLSRISIFIGSILAAVLGYLALKYALQLQPKPNADEIEAEQK